jgi:hypothetical protein
MINRVVGWVILVPLSLALIVFALANRHFVAINFNPFLTPETVLPAGAGVPLFIVLYVMLLIGVLLGGIATWFAQGFHRQRERHWRRESQSLQSELEKLRRSTGLVPDRGPLAEVDDLLQGR